MLEKSHRSDNLSHMPRPTWKQHAHDLARAFDVRLVEHDAMQRAPEEAVAVPGLRIVVVAPIFDETTYAVALHELGHVLAPCGSLWMQTGNRANLRRLEEDAAWDWARHYALEWTPVMEKVAQWARGTYDTPPEPPPAPAAPLRQQIDWEDWQ